MPFVPLEFDAESELQRENRRASFSMINRVRLADQGKLDFVQAKKKAHPVRMGLVVLKEVSVALGGDRQSRLTNLPKTLRRHMFCVNIGALVAVPTDVGEVITESTAPIKQRTTALA